VPHFTVSEKLNHAACANCESSNDVIYVVEDVKMEYLKKGEPKKVKFWALPSYFVEKCIAKLSLRRLRGKT